MAIGDSDMSTLSSPIYPTSPEEEEHTDSYEDGYVKRQEGTPLQDQEEIALDDDSEDEFIDVDDSHETERFIHGPGLGDTPGGGCGGSSGDESSSVRSPGSAAGVRRGGGGGAAGDAGPAGAGLPGGVGGEKKLYRCQHCKYVTDRKNNLKRHVVTMHEQCQKTLECCDCIFKNKASLRDHVLSCHRNGYDCRICGRNFCRKALLKRHITVHSGQKDYVCGVCGYATSHKSNLDRHKRRHGPKFPLDASKYRIPDSIDLECGVGGVSALSPASLSSSPPSVHSKCHAFSIERLVGDDYYPRRLPYADLHVPFVQQTADMFPIRVVSAETDFPVAPPPSSIVLPPKKRHLNSRYLFSRRLKCTHSRDQRDFTVKSDSGNNALSTHLGFEDHKSTSDVECKSEMSSAFSIVNKTLKDPGFRGLSPQPESPTLFSSKRLVPALYQCRLCELTFRSQVQMAEHFGRVQHEEWVPGPQRPLTLQARRAPAAAVALP